MIRAVVPRWTWAAWAAAGAGLEAAAVARGGHTLTSTLRRALGIRPRRRWAPLGVAAVLAFCTWLARHLTAP